MNAKNQKKQKIRKLQGCDNREVDREDAEWIEDVVEVVLNVRHQVATVECVDGVRDFIMYVDRAVISPTSTIEPINADLYRATVTIRAGMLRVHYYYDDKEDEWVVVIS